MAMRIKGMGDKPTRKDVGGKTYVAEEPAADAGEAVLELPFDKPVKAEKKPREAVRFI